MQIYKVIVHFICSSNSSMNIFALVSYFMISKCLLYLLAHQSFNGSWGRYLCSSHRWGHEVQRSWVSDQDQHLGSHGGGIPLMPHPVHVLYVVLCFLQYCHSLIKEKLHLQSLTVASVQIVTDYPNQKKKQQIFPTSIYLHMQVFLLSISHTSY